MAHEPTSTARARRLLGLIYYDGIGVSQDYTEAAKWFREAVERTHFVARRILGNMYADGEGVPQDFVLAHMWLNLAAAPGNIPATE
jgi:hypothetical protein|tara:strand:- start:46 stop:303 length:258 start_codon:yes stop_codon:yes gene_type:complete